MSFVIKKREAVFMYSKEYERARKEFINCMVLGIFCFGIPFVNAFKEWKPIMDREKRKALSAGHGPASESFSP